MKEVGGAEEMWIGMKEGENGAEKARWRKFMRRTGRS